MIKTCLLLCITLLPLVSCTDNRGNADIDKLIHAEFVLENPLPAQFEGYDLYSRMRYHKVPGLSISIVQDGEISWSKALGYKDLIENSLNNTETLFQAGSISKPVAALGILKLVDLGLVDLDENVNTYLKGYKIPNNEYTEKQKVTTRAILSHTAGLNVSGVEGYLKGDTLPTTEELISGKGNIESIKVTSKPNSAFKYSGGGYTIIQKMIEDITSQSFEDFMQREVFDPLGMVNSTYEQPLNAAKSENVSIGYDVNGDAIDGLRQVFPAKAAAGLWSTPSDLAKYCIEIQRIKAGEKGIISRELIDAMLADPFQIPLKEKLPPTLEDEPDDYWGLGPIVIGKNNDARFKHGGSNAGFKSNFTAYITKKDAIVIMTNGDSGYLLIKEIEDVLSKYYRFNTSNG